MESIISHCRRCSHVSNEQVVSSSLAAKIVSEWKCPKCLAPARDCRLEIVHVSELDYMDCEEDEDEEGGTVETVSDEEDRNVIPEEIPEETREFWQAIDDSFVSYQDQITTTSKGLDLGQIFALKCGKREDASEYCGVCQDPAVGDHVVELPRCKHKYHKLCINPWLVSNNSCPVCRERVV